jgi:hypothetical protein
MKKVAMYGKLLYSLSYRSLKSTGSSLIPSLHNLRFLPSTNSLAIQLGCTADQGCPTTWYDNDFDTVWEIKYVYTPTIQPSPKSTGTNYSFLTNDSTSNNHGQQRRRYLKHSKKITKHSDTFELPGWQIFGSVTQEYFDPLQYGNIVGDYPPNGTHKGGRWKLPYPEL